MSYADIGRCGPGGPIEEDVQWKRRACSLAIPYLRALVGPEPPDTSFRLHVDCRNLPGIGIEWFRVDPPPTAYIRKCRLAIQAFDDAVDWQKLHPGNFAAVFEEIDWEADEDTGDTDDAG